MSSSSRSCKCLQIVCTSFIFSTDDAVQCSPWCDSEKAQMHHLSSSMNYKISCKCFRLTDELTNLLTFSPPLDFYSTPSTEGVESTRGNSVCGSVCLWICPSSLFPSSNIQWFDDLDHANHIFSESSSCWQAVPPCSDPVTPSTNQYRPLLTKYSMIWWFRPCKPYIFWKLMTHSLITSLTHPTWPSWSKVNKWHRWDRDPYTY